MYIIIMSTKRLIKLNEHTEYAISFIETVMLLEIAPIKIEISTEQCIKVHIYLNHNIQMAWINIHTRVTNLYHIRMIITELSCCDIIYSHL